MMHPEAPCNTFHRTTATARSLVSGASAIVEYDRVRLVVIPRLQGVCYGTLLCVMKRCLVYPHLSFLAGKGLSSLVVCPSHPGTIRYYCIRRGANREFVSSMTYMKLAQLRRFPTKNTPMELYDYSGLSSGKVYRRTECGSKHGGVRLGLGESSYLERCHQGIVLLLHGLPLGHANPGLVYLRLERA